MQTKQLMTRANVLDYPKPGLCQDVWEDDNTLKPDIKADIMDKVNAYLSDVPWVETMRILGSLTSWQYNSRSDLDVHVVVDWGVLQDEYPGLDKEGLDEIVDSYRDAMREQQWKVLGTNHPLEISFETPDKVATTSDGIYNLLTDTWEQEPRSVESDFDPEAVYSSIIDEAEAITQELDISIGNVKRDIRNIEALEEALATLDSAARIKFQKRLKERMDELEEQLVSIMEKAYAVSEERDESYEPDSEENLTFKYLQKFGYIWLWKNLEKIMGEVEEQPALEPDNLSEIKNVIDEGWCEMDDKRAAKTTQNVPRGTLNSTKKGQKRAKTTARKTKVAAKRVKKSAWALTREAQEPGIPKRVDNEPKHIERGEAVAEPVKPIQPATPKVEKPIEKPEGVQPPKKTPTSPQLTVMKADEPRTESPAEPKRSGKAWQYDEDMENNVIRVLPDLVPDYLELDYDLYRPQITITHMDEDEGIVFGDVFVELFNKTTGVKDGEMRFSVSATVESGMNYEPEGQEFWSGLTDVDIAIEDMKKWAAISLQPVYVANRVLEMVGLEKLKGMEMEAIQHEIYTWLTRNQLKYTKEDVRKIHDQLSKQTGIEPPPPKEPKPEDIEGVGPKEKPVLPPTPVEEITQQKKPAPATQPEPEEPRELAQGQEPVLKTPVEAPATRPAPKVIGKMMTVRHAAPVEPPAKVYTYGLTYRPPSSATLPKGWLPGSTKPHKDFAHGTVDFPRILTKDEMDAFELAPLDPNHPINMKKAYEKRRESIVNTIDPEQGGVFEGIYPQPTVLSQDTRSDGGWRLTHFTDAGEPSGHLPFKDIVEAIDFIAKHPNARLVSVPPPPAAPPKTYGRMMVQKVGNRFVAVSKIEPDKLWAEYAKIITAHPNWKTNGHDWIIARAAGHPDFNRLLELESSFPNDPRVLQVKRTATDPQAALLDLACKVLGCDVNPNQTPFLNEKQAMSVASQFVATNNDLAAEDVYGMMVSWLWVKPAAMHAHTDTEAERGAMTGESTPARDRDKLSDPVETGTKEVFPKAGPSEPDLATNSARQLALDLVKLGTMNEDEIAEDLMRQFKLNEVTAFDIIDDVMTSQ